VAGIAGINVWRFVTAIAIGRGLRYFGEGALAVMYGEQALDYIHENARPVGLAIVGVLVAAVVIYVLWHRHKMKKADRLIGTPAPE
jgi:membrane protein DedA with SNARE-associated domain